MLQLPLAPTGVMAPMVRSWVVGHPDHNEHPELAALHNVAGSYRHPGMLWVSTEGDDRVYLVERQARSGLLAVTLLGSPASSDGYAGV